MRELAHSGGNESQRLAFLATTRVYKNLRFLEADRMEVALASENSKFSLANSHLPNPLASGGLIVRDYLPTERARTFAKAMRRPVTLANAIFAKISKARIASRLTYTSNNT